MTAIQNVNKSRWGYHACDHATFLKLKKLKKLYFKALYRYGEWVRWDRKQPQNRILRKWYRNDKGQKTGFEIVGKKPEPQMYPVFGSYRYVAEGCHPLNDMGVLDAFNIARHPYPTPEAVQPLGLTVEQIDNMLAHLEKFEG